MRKLVRLVSCLALLSAFQWSTVPAGAVASAAQDTSCPCCDGKAAVGAILACPGCQPAAPAGIAAPSPRPVILSRWAVPVAAELSGLPAAPAEPPPRSLSGATGIF